MELKKTNVARYSYLAGLFDGEGCIYINKNHQKTIISRDKKYLRKMKNPHYTLNTSTSMCDGKAIDFLWGNLGGYVRLKSTKTNFPIYEHTLCGKKAYEFIKKILPFCITKKSQIELGIQFYHYKTSRKPGFLSPHDLAFYEECFQKIKNLKRIFLNPQCATLETKSSDLLKKEDAIVQSAIEEEVAV